MIENIKNQPKGQTLIIFAFAILAMLAFAALMIDGGRLYVARRGAQALADAGALAGAKSLCAGDTAADAQTAAQNYGQNDPNGTKTSSQYSDGIVLSGDQVSASASVDTTTNTVTVSTSIGMDSFVAQVIGRKNFGVNASAKAICSQNPAYSNSSSPFTFSCQPAQNGAPTDPTADCRISTIPWTEFQQLFTQVGNISVNGTTITGWNPDTSNKANKNFTNTILPAAAGELYIVGAMGNPTAISGCYTDANGTVVCPSVADTSASRPATMGDTANHYITMAAKGYGWLELTQTDGGTALVSMMAAIYNNLPGASAKTHTWYSVFGGDPKDAYNNSQLIATLPWDDPRHIFIMPVYNDTCAKATTVSTACQTAAHTDFPLPVGIAADDLGAMTPNTSLVHAHVVGFATFYVTCARASIAQTINGVSYPNTFATCPGNTLISDDKIISGSNNPGPGVATLEGYFISGYPYQSLGGSGGAAAGSNFVSLIP